MRSWSRTLFSLAMIIIVILAASGGMVTAQSGGNYFDKVTVGGDVDIYGTGVIRDSRDDTIRQQVTSGGLTVAGAVTSPNIYSGHNGNSVAAGVQGAFIGGGGNGTTTPFGHNNIVQAGANYSVIAGGAANQSRSVYGSVGGGYGNVVFATGAYGTIGGGATNSVSGRANTVAGGESNSTLGPESTIGGGMANWVKGGQGVIAGGVYNYTGSGSFQAILGGNYNTIGTGRHGWYGSGAEGSMPENKLPYSFLDTMRGSASGDYSSITGGSHNAIGDPYSFIGNGYENWIAGYYTRTVTAPYELFDTAGCVTSTLQVACPGTFNAIVSGKWNEISNAYISYEEVEGGTELCQIDGYAVIAGGFENSIIGAMAQAAMIGGGVSNTITATYGVIAGGLENEVGGLYGAVPGGTKNAAKGAYSLAAGRRAKAVHDGAFVWADSQDADYASLAADTFNVRAQGGVRMTTSGAGLSLDGPVIVDGMTFTYTAPITITGVLTNVRLLYYQVP